MHSRHAGRRLWLDAALIAVITAAIAFLSGAQRWTGFNSPDSEFYASLALFGDEVTSRSEPAYTWTRLGYIAPVRSLVTTFDPWVGFAIWRTFLILLIVGSIFVLVRLRSTRSLAVIVAAFTGLNTVVLSFVGNTYLTGTVIAAVLLLVALGAWRALGTPHWAWLPGIMSGLVAGWLVMINPYGLLLGLTMWIGLRTVALVTDGPGRWRMLARDAVLAAAGFLFAFATFLIAGLAIFKGRNWFDTYLTWNSQLDYSSFIGDGTTWQRDIALLVPVVAVIVAVISLVVTRYSRAGIAAVVVSATSIVFTVVYILLVPGPWLEAPTYVAKLWPGALAGLALAMGAMWGQRRLGWLGWLAAAGFLPIALWSGRWDRDLSGVEGLLIAGVMVGMVIVAAWSLRNPRAWLAGLLVVVSVGTLAVGAQLLQNGRGLVGTYGQFPFRAAFVDFNTEMLMRSKVAAQEFVLANTARGEKVMLWTDTDRLTAGIAGMQLWGWYNNVPETAELSPDAAKLLAEQRPSAIVMYAPQQEQIDTFYASLPPWSLPSTPVCTTVPFLGIGSPEAHICVTHVQWLQ